MISEAVNRLQGKLIVSSQAMNPKSPLQRPDILAMLAQAAELGGAGGFRVDGTEVLAHLRPATRLPIIGIAKDRRAGFDTFITTSIRDAATLVEAGADIVAIQATDGTRPGESFAEIAAAVHRLGAAVMADISNLSEARRAAADGADIIATTMVGYTPPTRGTERPPLPFLRELVAALPLPIIIEGGLWTPEHVAACFADGAFAVVSGSAITAPDLITERLVAAIPRA